MQHCGEAAAEWAKDVVDSKAGNIGSFAGRVSAACCCLMRTPSLLPTHTLNNLGSASCEAASIWCPSPLLLSLWHCKAGAYSLLIIPCLYTNIISMAWQEINLFIKNRGWCKWGCVVLPGGEGPWFQMSGLQDWKQGHTPFHHAILSHTHSLPHEYRAYQFVLD